MSSTIDQRIVQMQFDNRSFEKNIHTTMLSLANLKKNLNFSGADKGFAELEQASKKCDFSAINNALNSVKNHFSALEIAGTTAIVNLTNNVVNSAKRMINSLTIAPISDGFKEYELKMGSIQTIMASTGETLGTVNEYLNELNEYSDRTIYSFSDMTTNIGKFTNAGVKLKDAVSAIQGISNVAAVSGANANEASHAMYNFAQALSAGYVKLIDWKSIEIANMATVEFKNQLIETALAVGTLVKEGDMFRTTTTDAKGHTSDLFNATKNFNDALSNQWMTTDVLVGTLARYSDETTEIGKKAFAAAQDVKTFSQLMDTLKESVGSGWAMTFEHIFGDFEEGKSLWTSVNNVVGDFINKQSEARNSVLRSWKALGGRTAAIEGFSNVFDHLSKVVNSVKDAFRDIFPRKLQGRDLAALSRQFRDFTATLKPSEETLNNVRRTFKGFFAVLNAGKNIVTTIFSAFSPLFQIARSLGAAILRVTANIGDFFVKISNTISQGKLLNNVMTDMVSVIDNISQYFTNFINQVSKNFVAPGLDTLYIALNKIYDVMQTIWSVGKNVFNDLFGGLSAPIKSLVTSLGNANFSEVLDIINSGAFATLSVGLFKFFKNSEDGVARLFDSVLPNLKSNFLEVMNIALDTFKSYQTQLKAETLNKIAKAIAILAGSFFVIASIDSSKMGDAIGAISILFAELIGSVAIFQKVSSGLGGAVKTIAILLGLSTSVLILSGALAAIASIKTDKLWGSVLAIGALVSLMVAASELLSMGEPVMKKGSLTMIGFAISIKILASACADLSELNWEQLGKGIFGVSTLMLALTGAMMAMPKGITGIGVGLILTSSAIVILSQALSKLGGMSWEEMAVGLVALGGSLGALAVGLNAMVGTLGGAAAMIIASTAMAIMTPILITLGHMEWESIVKGLTALGGSFAIIGGAAILLSHAIPAILGLGAAFALVGAGALGIGVGLLAAGAGLTAVAIGITSIAASSAAGATAIGAALASIISGIVSAIPAIATQFANGIVSFAKVIKDGAPIIGDAFISIITSALKVLSTCIPDVAKNLYEMILSMLSLLNEYAPKIIDQIITFAISLLDGLAKRIPELTQSIVNLVISFFSGVVDALKSIDSSIFKNVAIGVGAMAGIMTALAGVSHLTPAAMKGVLGMGVVAAELSGVLGVLGGLAQIPGLTWLIGEGGNLLQSVGTAIGQFFGGLAGGVATGFTSQLPQIGTDLSNFVTNAKPFIEGIKGMDSTAADGVKSLAEAILILTATDVVSGLTSWLTGGKTSLTSFGEDLASFGPKFKEYSDTIADINVEAVEASTNAIMALTTMASSIPESGGIVSWFTGDNDISDFGDKLVSFGESLKAYCDSLQNVVFDNQDTIDSIISFTDKLIGIATRIMDVDSSSLSSFVDSFKSLGTISMDALNTSFSNSGETISQIITNVFENFAIAIEEQKETYISLFKKLVDQALETINSYGVEFYKAGQEIMGKFITGIKSKNRAIRLAVSTCISGAASVLRDEYDGFYDAGAYLAEGFAQGIKDNASKAVAAASAMAQAAKKATTNTLHEKSPSKDGYKYGNYYGIGFVNGIQNNVLKSYDASRNMATSAKKALAESLSKILDYINDDTDMQPCIKPVLDLTDVESNARRISTLFSTDRAISVDSSLHYDYMDDEPKHTIQNGTTYSFVQNNYSPKALSRIDIYRQTKNQISSMRGRRV